MKKVTIILVALVMVLSLCACEWSATANTPAENTHTKIDIETNNVVSEVEQEPQDEQHLNDYAVEDFNIVDYPTDPNQSFVFRAKIRNLTKEKAYLISFSVQFLDKDGDVLNTGALSMRNLDSQQAGWTDVYGQGFAIPLTVDEVGSVRFYDYQVFDENNSFQYSGTLLPEIVFNIEDITVTTK